MSALLLSNVKFETKKAKKGRKRVKRYEKIDHTDSKPKIFFISLRSKDSQSSVCVRRRNQKNVDGCVSE